MRNLIDPTSIESGAVVVIESPSKPGLLTRICEWIVERGTARSSARFRRMATEALHHPSVSRERFAAMDSGSAASGPSLAATRSLRDRLPGQASPNSIQPEPSGSPPLDSSTPGDRQGLGDS